MPTVAEIAKEALRQEEEPKRLAAKLERERRAEAARQKRVAVESKAWIRLRKSLLAEWFPGVEWEFVEHFHGDVRLTNKSSKETLNMDVWQSGRKNAYDMVRLGLLNTGKVVFLEPWPNSHPDPNGSYRNQTRWTAYEVNSAADVARELSSYIERTTPPAWA